MQCRQALSSETVPSIHVFVSPDAVPGVLGDLIAPIFSPGLLSSIQKVHHIRLSSPKQRSDERSGVPCHALKDCIEVRLR